MPEKVMLYNPVTKGVYESTDEEAKPYLEAGYRPATPEQIKDVENQSKYGDAVGSAFIQGIGRGETAGLIDVAAAQGWIPGTDQESRREIKERNPISSFAGEMAGTALLSAATGGAGLLAKATSKTALGKAGLAAIRSGVASILPGVQMSITDQALHAQDPNEVADNILSVHGISNIAKSAATTALIGGAIGAGGSLAGSALSKGAEVASGKAKKLADYYTARSAGPYKRQWSDIERVGGIQNVSTVMREDGLVPEWLFAKPATAASNLKKSTKLADYWSDEIGKIVNKFEDVQIPKQDILSQINQDVLQDLSKFESQSEKRVARQVMGELRTIIPKTEGETISLPELKSLVNHISEKAKYAQKTQAESTLAFRDVRRILEDKVESTLDPLLAGLPEEKTYAYAKNRMKVHSWIRDTADNRVDAQSTNFGLPEMIAGTAVTAATGGPFNPMSIAKGMAAAAGTKVIRKTGDSLMAQALLTPEYIANATSRMAGANAQVGKAIERASKSLVTGAKVIPIASARAVSANKIEEFSRMVAEYRENPDLAVEHANAAFADLDDLNPDAANIARMKMAQALQIAAESEPKNPADTPENMLAAYDWKPSDAQSARFARIVNAIDDPLRVMQDLSNGMGDPDGARIIKELYPTLHRRLQDAVMTKLSEEKNKVPYARRILLSKLFEVPMDHSLKPSSIARYQRNFAMAQAQQPPAPSSGGSLTPPAPSNIARAEMR